jgi:predicted nucleotidyltransferase
MPAEVRRVERSSARGISEAEGRNAWPFDSKNARNPARSSALVFTSEILGTVDLGARLPELLEQHPRVQAVRLVGSRAEGRAHALSDWDFVVETADFDAVSRDLPELVAPLHPLVQGWDPYGDRAEYHLMLLGPTKVELLFLDEPHEWAPPWEPSPDTLAAIDRHFWEWVLFLAQKRCGGDAEVVREGLTNMHNLLLAPMGVVSSPESIEAALEHYREARSRLERLFGVEVPREVENEVAKAL